MSSTHWCEAYPLPPAEDDLAARVPVWAALSDLYANVGIDEGDLARIAEALAPSRYDVAQLEEILYREVHPVRRWALAAPAPDHTRTAVCSRRPCPSCPTSTPTATRCGHAWWASRSPASSC